MSSMDLFSSSGSLLASAPDLLDPNFMHTVVLMCQHSADGAYGLVVNRPAKVSIDQLLPEHTILGRMKFPVYCGGPVGLDTLQFVHRYPKEIKGGVDLCDGLFLGGDLDEMAEFLASYPDEAVDGLRLVLGYSGWAAGQLEAELESGSWLPAPLLVDAIFEPSQETSWRTVVRSLGDETRGMEDLPPDVSWN